MLKGTNRLFQFIYYWSSTVPIYLILLVMMLIQGITKQHRILVAIVGCLLVMGILSTIRLLLVLKDVQNYSRTLGTSPVVLKPLSARESILNLNMLLELSLIIVLGMLVNIQPTVVLLFIILYQLSSYRIYQGSGFIPNLTLELMGIHVYQVKKVDDSNLEYILSRTKQVKMGEPVKIINLGDPSYGVLGVINYNNKSSE